MVAVLVGEKRRQALQELRGWVEVEGRDAIRKTFHFRHTTRVASAPATLPSPMRSMPWHRFVTSSDAPTGPRPGVCYCGAIRRALSMRMTSPFSTVVRAMNNTMSAYSAALE